MSLYKTLMDLVYDITVQMLGLDPTTVPQNVKPLSFTESPAGLKDPHSDCVFYLVQFDDEGINRQIDDLTVPNSNPALTTKRTQYVRNLRIIWQTYGDDGFEWADTLRIKLMDQDILSLFKAQGITLIPGIQAPVYIPEKIGQQWYKRYDLFAKFNQLVTLESHPPAISGVDVIIIDEKGVIGTCSASPQL
jgi:hypothetical protein